MSCVVIYSGRGKLDNCHHQVQKLHLWPMIRLHKSHIMVSLAAAEYLPAAGPAMRSRRTARVLLWTTSLCRERCPGRCTRRTRFHIIDVVIPCFVLHSSALAVVMVTSLGPWPLAGKPEPDTAVSKTFVLVSCLVRVKPY